MEINNYLLKEEYEKKMINNYSVPWCFTNHAGHEKGAFFPFPEDEQQRKTLLRFLNLSDAHRVIILNRGTMFAFQWREFSPPLSSAHRLLQCYHRQKRDNERTVSSDVTLWRYPIWSRKFASVSLVVLWLFGDAQEFKHVLVCAIHFSEHVINKNEKLFLLIKKLKHVPLIASPSQMFLKGF